MVNAPVSYSKPELTSPAETSLKITDILGVAVFDLSGLPRDYFVTEENPATNWVQIVFQALGLQLLLASSLELADCHQITIQLKSRTAMVIQRQQDYVALLLSGQLMLHNQADKERLIAFAETLDPDQLRQHPHFQVN